MRTEWRKIRSGDRNLIAKGRPPVGHIKMRFSRYGLLSATKDERGSTKCLACQTFYADWPSARAHECADEPEYREYTGRYQIQLPAPAPATLNIDPMEYARTLIKLFEENEELKKEVAKLWEDMNKTTAPPAPKGLTNLFRS